MNRFQTNLREVMVIIAIIGFILGALKWVYGLQPPVTDKRLSNIAYQAPQIPNPTLSPPCEPGEHEAIDALLGMCMCIKCGTIYRCGPFHPLATGPALGD